MVIKKYKNKIVGLTITSIVIMLIFSVLVPPIMAVHLNPGDISSNEVTIEDSVFFKDVELTIKGAEKIPVNYLTFTIHRKSDGSVAAYIKFYLDDTPFGWLPCENKFTVERTSELNDNWYNNGYGYGYDEMDGNNYGYTGYGYGYGYCDYPDISIFYDIEYKTHEEGKFYATLTINSHYDGGIHDYISHKSDDFTVNPKPKGSSTGRTSSSGGYNPGSAGIPIEPFVEVNRPPTKPNLEGVSPARPNLEYSYSAVSTDPDGDNIMYFFDWGDTTNSRSELLSSGEKFEQTHTYKESGRYVIIVYAMDENDAPSQVATMSVLIGEPGAQFTEQTAEEKTIFELWYIPLIGAILVLLIIIIILKNKKSKGK